MISGLYAAASGMIATEGRMATIANNVANASTPGFRRQTPVQKGFYEVFLDRYRNPTLLNADPGPGGGLRFIETFTDTSGGPIAATGDPLNIALRGPGFLSVQTENGTRYTRNGKLAVDGDGQLSTEDGKKVLGQGGAPIDVAGGSVAIDRDGIVLVDGEPVTQLAMVEFADPHALVREGDNLFFASEEVLQDSNQAGDTWISPATLEMSNVQIPFEMTQMTLGLRMYGANQKVISAIDETMGRLINEVAAPL